MTPLPAEAIACYDRWACDYPPSAHNPLMRAEQKSMEELMPTLHGRRVLDLACGTGRYTRLLGPQTTVIVSVDLSTMMLSHAAVPLRIRADMCRLPMADQSFDVIVCGLAVGHVVNLAGWMHEMARVLRPGGTLLYSDFHPDAARAGLQRTFKDHSGTRRVLPHHVHSTADHRRAVDAGTLRLGAFIDLRAGIEVSEPFAGSDAFYSQWHGLPLVLVVAAHKARQ